MDVKDVTIEPHMWFVFALSSFSLDHNSKLKFRSFGDQRICMSTKETLVTRGPALGLSDRVALPTCGQTGAQNGCDISGANFVVIDTIIFKLEKKMRIS